MKTNDERRIALKLARHREQVRRITRRAIVRGDLIRPDSCSECSQIIPGEIDAHHDDYSKPLDIKWLCRRCHRMHHGYRS